MCQISDSEQQQDEFQPAAQVQKQRFSLSLNAWAVYAVGSVIFVMVQLFSKTSPCPSQYLTAYMLGLILGLFFFGIIPALLVFYLAKRSRGAASKTFIIMIALSVVGQIVEPVCTREKAPDGAVLNVIHEVDNWLDAKIVPFNTATTAMIAKSPMKPGWVKEKIDLEIARDQIRRVVKTNNDLRAVFEHLHPKIAEILASKRVPEEDRPRLTAAVLDHLEKYKASFLAARDHIDSMATLLLMSCDLLEENWGQWSFNADSNAVFFENANASDEFNLIVKDLWKLTEKAKLDLKEPPEKTKPDTKKKSRTNKDDDGEQEMAIDDVV